MNFKIRSQVKVLKERLPVLDEIDKALAEIYKFNQVDSISGGQSSFLLDLKHCIGMQHFAVHIN